MTIEVKEEVRRFFIKELVLGLVLSGLSFFLFATALKEYSFGAYPLQLLIIVITTGLGHILTVKAIEKNPRQFTTAFTGAITIKLMVYLTFVLLYLLIDKTQAFAFVTTFLVYYLSFTVLEIRQILGLVKKSS